MAAPAGPGGRRRRHPPELVLVEGRPGRDHRPGDAVGLRFEIQLPAGSYVATLEHLGRGAPPPDRTVSAAPGGPRHPPKPDDGRGEPQLLRQLLPG